jgi:hypothetical protein
MRRGLSIGRRLVVNVLIAALNQRPNRGPVLEHFPHLFVVGDLLGSALEGLNSFECDGINPGARRVKWVACPKIRKRIMIKIRSRIKIRTVNAMR